MSNRKLSKASPIQISQFQRIIWITLLVWTLGLLSSLSWNIRGINKNLLADARLHALIAFNKDVKYRSWNAKLGGVYAKMSDYARPNSYLSVIADRDKFATDGDSLTMINPAYMTRQIHEIEFDESGVLGHITSLNPIRPENKADPWEIRALEQFSSGIAEVYSTEMQGDVEYFRFMRPLTVEQSCLNCHEHQGYKLGDIRGGISVSIPWAPLKSISDKNILRMGLAHGAIWLVGVLGALIFSIRMREATKKQKQAVELLQILNMAIDQSQEVIFTTDMNGIFTSINPGFTKTYGYEKEEVVDKVTPRILRGSSLPNAYWEQFWKNLMAKENIGSIHYVNKDKFGKQIDIEGSADPILDDNGDIIGFLAIQRDITDRKRSRDALVESNNMRELLLDIITHDLRNPAATIFSFSELAKNEYPDNQIIEHIHMGSNRLIKVLDNTALLAQATFGDSIPREVLNLADVMSKVVGDFSSPLVESSMTLSMNIPADIEISANLVITEIFNNYISNAIKYASHGEKIVVEALTKDESVLISVKDFGTTILLEEREKIFTRTVQLPSASKKGSGLGLAIVKRIAAAHDGEVWVEPNTPSGNSFCLRLPRQKA